MTPKRIAELRGLREGMASGEYVSDVSPYHAELLDEALAEIDKLDLYRQEARRCRQIVKAMLDGLDTNGCAVEFYTSRPELLRRLALKLRILSNSCRLAEMPACSPAARGGQVSPPAKVEAGIHLTPRQVRCT